MDNKKHSDMKLYYGSETLYNELTEFMKDVVFDRCLSFLV